MHPDGDEILYVISGELTVHADSLDAPLTVPAGKAVIVHKGEWHKLTADEPCRIVHITPRPQRRRAVQVTLLSPPMLTGPQGQERGTERAPRA